METDHRIVSVWSDTRKLSTWMFSRRPIRVLALCPVLYAERQNMLTTSEILKVPGARLYYEAQGSGPVLLMMTQMKHLMDF